MISYPPSDYITNIFSMVRNLGFLTAYGIEYTYDFLGKDRIKIKLEELKDKPTMGITFDKFINNDPQYAYFNGKGIFWIFCLILDWFEKDLDLFQFLYEKTKSYTEENYFEQE